MGQTIMQNVYPHDVLDGVRYYGFYKAGLSGWILIQNNSLWDVARVHFDGDFLEYDIIKPRHQKYYQVDTGDQLYVSFAADNQMCHIQNARYKPQAEEYIETPEVESLPYHADGVAVTTTYNFSDTATYATLRKGFITHVQVIGEGGGFTGTVEVSDDGGVTYSPAAAFDPADPNKVLWELSKLMTHVRVTVTAGTFSIEAY